MANAILKTEYTAVLEQFNVTDYFHDYVNWIDRPGKTTRTYLTNLKQFAAWLSDNRITQPTRQDILSYRQYLEEDKGCKPATVKAYLQTVKAFFKWTAQAGLYPDIASNVHTPKVTDTHKKEALDTAAVVEIETSIKQEAEQKVQKAQQEQKDTNGRTQRATEQGKRLYAIYLLAVNAGLRTVEISRLNVGDFVTHGGQAWIYLQGKGHSEADQKKALAPEVAEAIKDYLQSRRDNLTADNPLFVSTGNRSGGKRIATTTISTMLKKAMQEAGYNDPRITAHSLRHTAGTAVMEMSGNNIYETQKYMRHANPATTEIYLHTDEEALDTRTANELYSYYHQQEGGTNQ